MKPHKVIIEIVKTGPLNYSTDFHTNHILVADPALLFLVLSAFPMTGTLGPWWTAVFATIANFSAF